MTKVYAYKTTYNFLFISFREEIKDLLLNVLQQEYYKERSIVSRYMTKVSKENYPQDPVESRRGDKLFPKSFIDRFCSVLYMQLFIDLMNMYSYCTGCNTQLLGDLFVQ